MAVFLDAYARLEPTSPAGNLDEGFAARIADPAWFLGRQWQLGEHHGEDAGSPVLVHYDVILEPLVDPFGRDAVHTPTEALIEAAPHQWWTPARRIREGRRLLASAAADPALAERLGAAALHVADLPPPYALLNGRAPDGLAIYRRRDTLGVPADWFADLPLEATRLADHDDPWDAARFEFRGALAAGEVELQIDRHDGGRVDWYSCTAHPSGSGSEAAIRESATAIPGRLDYAGAPAPRWWQIEERQWDVGGFPPDRSHFATLLLIDVVSSHADDWFVIPIDTRTAGLGHLVVVERLRVMDSFGEIHHLAPPVDGWKLFQVDGLEHWALPLLPTVVSPLTGPTLDDVEISLDEDANLVWAWEHRIAGRETKAMEPAPQVATTVGSSGTSAQRYEPNSALQPHWHPYQLAYHVAGERRRVTAVRRREGAITHLLDPGSSWSPVPVGVAIAEITGGLAGYYVETADGGQRALQVRRVLTTSPDDQQENNLGALPECTARYGAPPPPLLARGVTSVQRDDGGRVRALCNDADGWRVTVGEAFSQIRARTHEYFVVGPGGATRALACREYVTTAPNLRADDNLDFLPEG